MDNRATVEDFRVITQKYIAELNSLPEAEAKKKARKNLIKIGVLDNNGNVKANIVKGDFFGW